MATSGIPSIFFTSAPLKLDANKPRPCVLTMKAVLQRVLSSSVTVNEQVVSAIGKGILVLAAIGPHDTKKDADSMAAKVLKMKLWPDEDGSNWKKSVQDIEGEVLCVSQFTLFASTKKGNKPDFHGAAKPEMAKELYEYFLSKVRTLYHAERVRDGVFQAMMQVSLVNDGPVTLEIDTAPAKKESAATTPTSSTPASECAN
ncbi:D-tyrosyl-tRNA(Tyr) deacylase [Exophiala sideris]|uniref:D-aminoacyl-tRNA deacylase n=1 Tax=Exophiala sideris TaxID=1016849 RepID=A0A0D1VZR0_9EURO|nr:D-tyrosyl-tRNA(Tyr) deacylase [Exophiala sideris]